MREARRLAKEIGPRFAKRAKRRKINRILNIAIAVVILLIVVVAWNLFSGGGSGSEAADAPVKTEAKKGGNEKKVEVEIGNKQQEKESKPSDNGDEAKQDNGDETKQKVIETPGPPGSNIEKEIVNPAWQPIGTTQSEPHVTQFKEDSVDWKEMLDAVSYATGLSQSDMIVWFIGNNGPNKAVATISTKDRTQRYKVYIEWVENQGWKPTKVQKLRR
jgi:hypothetical protein